MANPFAQFAQPTSPTPEENPFAQFATPSSVANPFAGPSLEGNPFAQFAVEPAQYIDARTKKEAPGFVGSFTSALKERVETAAPAAKLYFGIGDQAKSTEELLAARKKAAEEYKQTEFSDIGEAFRQGNYGDALSKTYDKFKEVAGSSFGAMAPAMGAGAAAAFAAPAAVPAVLAGTAAYGITALGSYIADNIARQKEEQKARGKEGEDINRLTASAAATGQTALDIFGFKFFKPLGQLVGLEGKAAADRAAMEIVEAATRPGAYRRAVATGAAKGIAFEVPQEVSQQLLERWQAGLDVNPFTDPTAAKEYLEAAGGALLLGGPMGAASRVAQTRTARKLVGEEPAGEARAIDDAQAAIDAELKSYADREGAPVAPTEEAGVVVPTQEVSDVTQPTETVAGAVEPSAAMPVGGVEAATAGVETSLASGLATAEQLTGEPITGAAVQPTPLTQPLPTYEEAQAVFDSQPNKEQLEIMEVPDGGFVVAQRAPIVEPTAVAPVAPTEMVGEAAPVETSGVAPEAVQPAVQVAPAEAVEAAPVPEVTEPVEAKEKSFDELEAEREALKKQVEPIARANAIAAKDNTLALADSNEYLQNVFDTLDEEGITDPRAKEYAERAFNRILEGEPRVAEAIETVQAKEERPQETAATVAAIAEQAEAPVRKRAPGGGRKKSEAAKTTEERKAQAADLIQDARDIEGRAKAVQKLSLGFAPEQFAKRGVSAEAAQTAYEEAEAARKEDLWNNKMYLYIASVDPTRRNTKAGRIAQEAVAQFTPQEQAQYKELYDSYRAAQGRAPLKSESIYMSDEADPKFGSATTAQQALRRIMNTGKPFEKLLAQRLLNAVKGIQFVVIRPDTKLPAEISKAFKDTTQGVYSEARKTIYVRDESFGDVNGVNNTTILHEALHAATTLRLDYALALAERGELDTAPALQAFAQMMTKTMERAELVYRVAKAEGRSTPYLDALYKVGAFTDVREFVSYGLTDNMMQQFLATKVPGMKMSMFSRFVEAIRKLFGFDANSQSAFQDLVVTTDALLSERLPRDASIIATTSDTLASIKDDGKKAKDFDTKLRQPLASPEESLTTIGQIIKIRSWADAKDVMSDIYNGTSSQFRRPLLGALTTRQLTELNAAKEMTDADGKPLLDEVLRIAEDMNGAKSKMLDDTAAMAKTWHEWQLANPGKYRTLNRLIHLSTINQIDPSVDTRSATLTQMYEALGEDGKKLYNDIRDFYKARFDKYKQILLDRIAQTEADEATKAQIIAKLEKDFEKLPQPYFPLVREGKYWVRVGNPKSPNMEYYMFEDPRERNFFVRQRAKELGTTVEALKEDPDQFAMGDDFKQAVDEGMRSSKMLKDILELVDNASMADKTALKDEIHQLYFSTLPEQNFRKHFLHRKGTAGFRSDALRNFAKSSFHTSVQLAKIEYGQKLRNSVTRAWDATEGKPQRDTLFRPLYDEMRDRVENVLSPDRSDAMATKFANVLGSASFFYYMSAPASALTNLTGLYVFGMPVLNGEFGAKANLALAKNMNVFKAVGTTDKDGKFTFPTLLSKLTGHRRDAYMEALRRGKIDTTLTYDTLQLSRTPSEKYDGGSVTTKIMNAMGYLFHHSEKINREVMFMTAYDLAYERATKDGRNAKTAQEEALNEASRLTDEAMFDYSEFNKPRFFRGNVARVLLQFKSFAQQTTFYLVKNFRAMFKGADAEVRKTAATKFVGTLGMTAMFAGALGLPLVSVIAYAMSFLTEDDEDPERRNPKFRFKKFLTDTFGENLGLIIERGPVSWATDVDFHSRTKLDQLWFRELKTGKSEPETLREFIINMMGPSVGLGVNVAEAMRRINNGDTQRGMELLLPAGLRGFAVAYRQQGIPFVDKGEGVKTLKGDVVADPEALTEANRIATMAGFGTTRVAAKQEDISQIRAEIDSRTAQRREALDLFKDLLDEFTFGKRDAAVQAVVKYNKANPYDAIDVDTVFSTIEREAEARGKSIDGLRVTDKLRPLVMRMMPSRAPLKKAPD